MVWRPDGPTGAECAKIRHLTPAYTRGKGLDIGAGAHRLWPHCITVDNYDELAGRAIDADTGRPYEPDVICDAETLYLFADQSMDFVFSSHLLEHLDDTEAVLTEWWRVLKPGGYMTLYLPHADLYPQIGQPGANPNHLHDFRPGDIESIMTSVGVWDLVVNEIRAKGDEYSFLQVYKRLEDEDGTHHSYLEDQSITQPRLLLVRYGGIGDHIIIQTVLPKLKAEGYHITVNTVPTGAAVLQENPYVDKILVQDRDQVPPDMLSGYWKALEGEYDRCINMSESLEGTLLCLPGRRDHALTHEARRMMCDVNYLEFAHAVAGVSGEPEQIFYSTDAEKAWATKFREPHKETPVVLWALGGSACHKMYPYADIVTTWLLEHTDCKVLFVGSDYEQHLEHQVVVGVAKHFLGMEQEAAEKAKLSELLVSLREHFDGQNRILCTSGRWTIRETLTFVAEQADIVVGPETGVMHAVGMRETPTIVFLSHSTEENLTKHWVNVSALKPADCPCFPCHMLHSDFLTCVQHEDTGASLCSANIEAARVFDTIRYWLTELALSTDP